MSWLPKPQFDSPPCKQRLESKMAKVLNSEIGTRLVEHNEVVRDTMSLSSAVSHLENGMYGGVHRPRLVAELKEEFPRASIGFGLWRSKAADVLWKAVLACKLTLYVVPAKRRDAGHSKLLVVPVAAVNKMVMPATSLPDRAVRVPASLLREGILDEPTFTALRNGSLVLSKDQFIVWYGSEWKKGKWPSQSSRRKRSVGRPSKQTALRNKVIALVNDGRWSAERSLSELRRIIFGDPLIDPVSEDTLARLVDQLFLERGDRRFQRRKRRKSQSGFPQNSAPLR